MRRLCRVFGGAKPHQAAESHGPMLRENHEKMQQAHDAKPEHRPEAREILPREVDFLDRFSDVIARQVCGQRCAMAVLGVWEGPAFFLGTGKHVVVLFTYSQEALGRGGLPGRVSEGLTVIKAAANHHHRHRNITPMLLRCYCCCCDPCWLPKPYNCVVNY